MQLLDARAQADAEPFAAAEGDQRVRELVALAERIGPRIHEAEDALHAVGRGEHEQPRSRRPACRAAPAKCRRSCRRGTARRTRSRRSPPARRSPARAAAATTTSSITASIGSRPCLKLFMHAVLAHGVVRGVEHDGELHQLRGLQAREPAAASQRRAPFTSRPTPGISTSDEQRHTAEEEPRRRLLPQRHGHQEHRERRRRSAAPR